MELEAYINKYKPFAALVATAEIPIALILTHSFLESGKGESLLTQKGNNFFGVKARQGEKYIDLLTKELINGKEYTLHQKFKVYTSPAASFADYVRLLNLPRYTSVRQAKTIPGKFLALGRSGYFTAGKSYIKTATTLSKQVESILKQNNTTNLPLIIIAFLGLSLAFLNK